MAAKSSCPARPNRALARAERTSAPVVQSDAAAQKVQELLQQLAEKRQALAAAQNEYYLAYTEKKNRIEALSRMEELFEGYSRSVRFIMNAYGQKKLRCAALHGPVSKLISVQQRFATAVETAFGGNMQNIVVQDEESAKEAIRYLKEQNGGRATFYPIETVRAQRAPDISAAKGIAGFLGTVSEHVDCAPEYREVVDAMIGKILIADTIESAAKVAKAMRYTVRVVTLDGQQVNAGGSFTGGSLRQDSGLLTRAAQIDALRREMNEFSEKIKKAQREDEALAKEEQTQKDALATEQMHSQMLRTLQNAEQTQLQVLKTQADAEQAQLDTLAEQSALLQNEEAAYFAQKEALSAAQQAAEGTLDLKKLASLPDEALFARLMELDGVGKKVANCVCLFGYGRVCRVPVDVWIERLIRDEFAGQDPFPQFGLEAGIVQQYLFFYKRSVG